MAFIAEKALLWIKSKLNQYIFTTGGVPSLEDIAPTAVEGEPSAFEGCIRELVVNYKQYKLTERGQSGEDDRYLFMIYERICLWFVKYRNYFQLPYREI